MTEIEDTICPFRSHKGFDAPCNDKCMAFGYEIIQTQVFLTSGMKKRIQAPRCKLVNK